MTKRGTWIMLFVVIILIIIGIGQLGARDSFSDTQEKFSKDEAINTVKLTYEDMREYPSDTLPPREIRAEKKGKDWYLAFVQLGSGRPIISAQCFMVTSERTVQSIGFFLPEEVVADFDTATCGAK